MDHVVYLDAKAKEFEKLIEGTKSMIIRGAAGRKMPYDRVFKGDWLFVEDIEYDTKNNMESVISIIANKKNCDFTKYISALSDYYTTQAKKIKSEKPTEKKLTIPIDNFYNMIEKNIIKIQKETKTL